MAAASASDDIRLMLSEGSLFVCTRHYSWSPSRFYTVRCIFITAPLHVSTAVVDWIDSLRRYWNLGGRRVPILGGPQIYLFISNFK